MDEIEFDEESLNRLFAGAGVDELNPADAYKIDCSIPRRVRAFVGQIVPDRVQMARENSDISMIELLMERTVRDGNNLMAKAVDAKDVIEIDIIVSDAVVEFGHFIAMLELDGDE